MVCNLLLSIGNTYKPDYNGPVGVIVKARLKIALKIDA
jgi:hypothetical protein